MLVSEGFRNAGLVDIFDAGPTVSCPREDIRTVRDALSRRVRIADAQGERVGLLSTAVMESFRAVRGAVGVTDEHAVIGAETAEALKLRDGDAIRVKL
jgi:arginine N-succinyltransferase